MIANTSSQHQSTDSGLTLPHIRVGNETLAAKKGGDKLFYHNDHLGGVDVI